ncbi:MarR family winged helix-turn-helix transcriptional regulator [Brevibacillus sp. B_LB10_24]|uniref:MarR family winged helix-turn-helix transcriptional regulator n=1 Tax=Brevibacillus sp. B_LB10_24 TaxID=3380645 RepID=UPI0038B706AF
MDKIVKLSETLNQTNKLFFDILTIILADSGLTRLQVYVLKMIKDSPRTIGELSKLTELPYSTTSGIIDRLERQHLVVRQKDEHDRRVVRVYLADRPEVLEKKVPFLSDDCVHQLFEGITDEDAIKISDALDILNSYLIARRDTLKEQKGSE